jgi:hypothetical protein
VFLFEQMLQKNQKLTADKTSKLCAFKSATSNLSTKSALVECRATGRRDWPHRTSRISDDGRTKMLCC